MDVPGLCMVCHRPGVLATCPLCGVLGHPDCLRTQAHLGTHGGAEGGPGPGIPPGPV